MESVSVSRIYCEPLDRFVAVKKCSAEDISFLIRDIPNALGRKTYIELVIAYCIVNYFTEIAPAFDEDSALACIADIIKDDLYGMCIGVNPDLDIKKIRIAS